MMADAMQPQQQRPAPAVVAGPTCAACNTSNPAGAKFCMACGTAIAPQVRHCTECGNELPGGAKFCANCGTRA
jgi:membrane protease subunit (stomatin/prohibitin family)